MNFIYSPLNETLAGISELCTKLEKTEVVYVVETAESMVF